MHIYTIMHLTNSILIKRLGDLYRRGC